MQRALGAGRSSGLTLVEVLVTVAVVSLLVAILAPVIAGNVEGARTARATNEVQVIAAAVGAFYKDVGRWPSMDAVGAYGGPTTLVSTDAAAPAAPGAWRGPYLEKIPDDPWNTPYLVNIAATDDASGIDKGFVLSSGPNAQVETPFAAGRATVPGGDDIAAVFFLR